ncbi:MAG TPA: isochorismatase family cysteine hydrolase [Polyangiaceae bacterium]|nr:isochorismatase family cysteine hydrolase [Polyangiaceae bacterium]
MAEFQAEPQKIALLNVDLQNIFVQGSPIAAPDGPAVVERVNRLSAACRRLGIPVVHTLHVTRPDGSNVGVLGEIIPPVKDGLIARGSPPALLHSRVQVDPTDILLEKPRYGAFHGTDLELILRSRGIDSVIITGIATNVCAETTAREACVRDFRVFFMSDGTATNDMGGVPRAELQRATLAVLAFGFAQVLTVDEMIAKLESAG